MYIPFKKITSKKITNIASTKALPIYTNNAGGMV